MTFNGYEVKNCCIFHTYAMTSSHHLNMKRLQQLGTEQQSGQFWARLKVKGTWVTFKGHKVKNSFERHTYTIISSYHLNR